MFTRSIALATVACLVLSAGPAFAQFASSGGAAGGTSGGAPNISGAGTGLSAPATAQSNPGLSNSGLSNPNAIQSPATAAPVQPIYPGVGIGGAGLPPVAVLPPTARRAAHASTGTSGTPH